jgi:uncharacterized repeat protein (TIGR03803 family)
LASRVFANPEKSGPEPIPGGARTETVLYAFTGANDVAHPHSDLIADVNGDLYGTTMQGGSSGNGVAFKLASPIGFLLPAETALYSFAGSPANGSNSQAGLIGDKAGNLYGAAQSGGANGLGTIFRLMSTDFVAPISCSVFTATLDIGFGKNPGTDAFDGFHRHARCP